MLTDSTAAVRLAQAGLRGGSPSGVAAIRGSGTERNADSSRRRMPAAVRKTCAWPAGRGGVNRRWGEAGQFTGWGAVASNGGLGHSLYPCSWHGTAGSILKLSTG
jgi:hypothetical protein